MISTFSHYFTTSYYSSYPISIGVGFVAAASAAYPPLASTTAAASTAEASAAVRVLRAGDPPRLSDSGRVVHCRLGDRYNAV